MPDEGVYPARRRLRMAVNGRPAPPRPEDSSYCRAVDERRIADVLEGRRRELQGELARLTERPTDPVGNLSFGKRIGDGTTEAVERINTTAMARSVAATLSSVERALVKLAEGTYGICDGCGEPIRGERLEAVPWTAHCVACAGRRR